MRELFGKTRDDAKGILLRAYSVKRISELTKTQWEEAPELLRKRWRAEEAEEEKENG